MRCKQHLRSKRCVRVSHYGKVNLVRMIVHVLIHSVYVILRIIIDDFSINTFYKNRLLIKIKGSVNLLEFQLE